MSLPCRACRKPSTLICRCCDRVAYCNQQCQRRDYPIHKHERAIYNAQPTDGELGEQVSGTTRRFVRVHTLAKDMAAYDAAMLELDELRARRGAEMSEPGALDAFLRAHPSVSNARTVRLVARCASDEAHAAVMHAAFRSEVEHGEAWAARHVARRDRLLDYCAREFGVTYAADRFAYLERLRSLAAHQYAASLGEEGDEAARLVDEATRNAERANRLYNALLLEPVLESLQPGLYAEARAEAEKPETPEQYVDSIFPHIWAQVEHEVLRQLDRAFGHERRTKRRFFDTGAGGKRDVWSSEEEEDESEDDEEEVIRANFRHTRGQPPPDQEEIELRAECLRTTGQQTARVPTQAHNNPAGVDRLSERAAEKYKEAAQPNSSFFRRIAERGFNVADVAAFACNVLFFALGAVIVGLTFNHVTSWVSAEPRHDELNQHIEAVFSRAEAHETDVTTLGEGVTNATNLCLGLQQRLGAPETAPSVSLTVQQSFLAQNGTVAGYEAARDAFAIQAQNMTRARDATNNAVGVQSYNAQIKDLQDGITAIDDTIAALGDETLGTEEKMQHVANARAFVEAQEMRFRSSPFFQEQLARYDELAKSYEDALRKLRQLTEDAGNVCASVFALEQATEQVRVNARTIFLQMKRVYQQARDLAEFNRMYGERAPITRRLFSDFYGYARAINPNFSEGTFSAVIGFGLQNRVVYCEESLKALVRCFSGPLSVWNIVLFAGSLGQWLADWENLGVVHLIDGAARILLTTTGMVANTIPNALARLRDATQFINATFFPPNKWVRLPFQAARTGDQLEGDCDALMRMFVEPWGIWGEEADELELLLQRLPDFDVNNIALQEQFESSVFSDTERPLLARFLALDWERGELQQLLTAAGGAADSSARSRLRDLAERYGQSELVERFLDAQRRKKALRVVLIDLVARATASGLNLGAALSLLQPSERRLVETMLSQRALAELDRLMRADWSTTRLQSLFQACASGTFDQFSNTLDHVWCLATATADVLTHATGTQGGFLRAIELGVSLLRLRHMTMVFFRMIDILRYCEVFEAIGLASLDQVAVRAGQFAIAAGGVALTTIAVIGGLNMVASLESRVVRRHPFLLAGQLACRSMLGVLSMQANFVRNAGWRVLGFATRYEVVVVTSFLLEGIYTLCYFPQWGWSLLGVEAGARIDTYRELTELLDYRGALELLTGRMGEMAAEGAGLANLGNLSYSAIPAWLGERMQQLMNATAGVGAQLEEAAGYNASMVNYSQELLTLTGNVTSLGAILLLATPAKDQKKSRLLTSL